MTRAVIVAVVVGAMDEQGVRFIGEEGDGVRASDGEKERSCGGTDAGKGEQGGPWILEVRWERVRLGFLRFGCRLRCCMCCGGDASAGAVVAIV